MSKEILDMDKAPNNKSIIKQYKYIIWERVKI